MEENDLAIRDGITAERNMRFYYQCFSSQLTPDEWLVYNNPMQRTFVCPKQSKIENGEPNPNYCWNRQASSWQSSRSKGIFSTPMGFLRSVPAKSLAQIRAAHVGPAESRMGVRKCGEGGSIKKKNLTADQMLDFREQDSSLPDEIVFYVRGFLRMGSLRFTTTPQQHMERARLAHIPLCIGSDLQKHLWIEHPSESNKRVDFSQAALVTVQ